MNWIERWHGARVHTRRVRILAGAAARLLPAGFSVLDIGCGDGQLAATLGTLRPDLTLTGVEISPRPHCQIPVSGFDGRELPFGNGRFDAALLVDVLHHTADPGVLLGEAGRVARHVVLVKDHFREGFGAQATLRLMDEVGNRRHGVALPFNYLSRREWDALFARCGLTVQTSNPLRELYPLPARLIFGRGLHFFARLGPRGTVDRRLPPQP